MSRGLGPVQRRALHAIDVSDGVTVPRLASILGIGARRARYVVSSLAERDLVRIVTEDGTRRVWSPGRHDTVMAERALREYHEGVRRMARLRLEAPWCPTCGQTLPPQHPQIRSADAPESGPRPVERGGAVGDDDEQSGGVAPARCEPVAAVSTDASDRDQGARPWI